MKVTPIKHDYIEMMSKSVETVRSEGLHMSDIYGALYEKLEPKRFKKGSKPDQMRMEMGVTFERILEDGLRARLTERPDEQSIRIPGLSIPLYFSPDLLIFNHVSRVGEIKLTWMSSSEVPREKGINVFPPKFDKYFCVHPNTQLLTEDLEYQPADEVEEGCQLIGFDEHPLVRGWRHYRRTTVTNVQKVKKPCVRLELADGSSIICSSDHHWLALRHEQAGASWIRTDDLLKSDQTVGHPRTGNAFLSRPLPLSFSTNLREYDRGWLAGMFDGEGSLSNSNDHGSLRLTISQRHGPTLDRIRDLLAREGFDFASSEQDGCVTLYETNTHQIIRALGVFRPERLIGRLYGLSLPSLLHLPVQVVARTPIGDKWVAGLETDSHTFIAEGLASHNTQMKLYCRALETPYARLIAGFVNGRWDFKDKENGFRPELLAWDIEFTPRELQEEWDMTMNFARSEKIFQRFERQMNRRKL